jgi:phosphoribosylaminoimidazolecarboxamide formyltransferase/IMP cyclohydrolase
VLRYGENPDQEAAFYGYGAKDGLAALEQKHGKDLSYNNILDLDGSLLCLSPFAFSHRPAVCIVKHTTPCGLAVGDSLAEAYERALACDPVSAFGSVIAVNRTVGAETAELMSKLFVECVVAPGFSDEAMAILTAKKNIRLMTFPSLGSALPFEPDEGWWAAASEEERGVARFMAAHGRLPAPRALRSVFGGMLAQTPAVPPFYGVFDADWKVVTSRQPTAEELDDLGFAWAAVYGVKSNAILLAGGGATLGIGAGQMSRVDSSRIAVRKAADQNLDLNGAVLASDAFFPFRDGVDAAAEAGVKAIIQPGGSIRDDEVIDAANEHGIAMVFTARRLFRH